MKVLLIAPYVNLNFDRSSELLNREDFSKVSIDIKKDLIKKGVIKVGYSLNSSKYRDLLSKDLIPSELEDAVKKYDRKSFYISFRDVKLK